MTLWDLILALVRRWPVVLAGAVLTAGLGLLSIRDDGVYWTRTEVILLAPSAWYPNRLEVSPWTISRAVGVVVKRMVGAGETIKYADPAASLIGTSTTREGTWIRQLDEGGQWSSNFSTPIIVIEVVAPTMERTRELQNAAIDQIDAVLTGLQNEWNVARNLWITITVAPASTVIYHVGASKTRALAMTVAVGIGITVGVVLMLEYRRRRRAPARRGVAGVWSDEDEVEHSVPARSG